MSRLPCLVPPRLCAMRTKSAYMREAHSALREMGPPPLLPYIGEPAVAHWFDGAAGTGSYVAKATEYSRNVSRPQFDAAVVQLAWRDSNSSQPATTHPRHAVFEAYRLSLCAHLAPLFQPGMRSFTGARGVTSPEDVREKVAGYITSCIFGPNPQRAVHAAFAALPLSHPDYLAHVLRVAFAAGIAVTTMEDPQLLVNADLFAPLDPVTLSTMPLDWAVSALIGESALPKD